MMRRRVEAQPRGTSLRRQRMRTTTTASKRLTAKAVNPRRLRSLKGTVEKEKRASKAWRRRRR
jgi:hypothetical protein